MATLVLLLALLVNSVFALPVTDHQNGKDLFSFEKRHEENEIPEMLGQQVSS